MGNEIETYMAMSRDLGQCNVLEAFGNAAQKRQARKHRKAIHAVFHADSVADGTDKMTDDELLAELFA